MLFDLAALNLQLGHPCFNIKTVLLLEKQISLYALDVPADLFSGIVFSVGISFSNSTALVLHLKATAAGNEGIAFPIEVKMAGISVHMD